LSLRLAYFQGFSLNRALILLPLICQGKGVHLNPSIFEDPFTTHRSAATKANLSHKDVVWKGVAINLGLNKHSRESTVGSASFEKVGNS